MNRRVNVANRLVLTLLGLALLAGGVLGFVLSLGGFGSARASTPLLQESWRRYADGQEWFWWAILGGCLVLALLGLLWLRAQLATNRLSRLDLTEDPRQGVTLVHASAVTEAVAAEVESLRGVTHASARLTHRPRALQVVVGLSDHADIAEVRSALLDTTVAHVRQAVDEPGLPIDFELRPAAGKRRSLA